MSGRLKSSRIATGQKYFNDWGITRKPPNRMLFYPLASHLDMLNKEMHYFAL